MTATGPAVPIESIDSTVSTTPIAAACSSSTYERARVHRRDVFARSIPAKLTTQAFLLVALAGAAPIVALYPPSVASLFPVDPLGAAPRAALLGVLAVGIETLTAAVLVVVALVRLRWEPDMTEARAAHLLDVEAVASLFGLGTSGVAVVATNGFLLLGLTGRRTVLRVGTLGGNHPFTASGTGVSVATVAIAALCGALALGLASRYVARRWADAGLA